jgi:hypothetical protein
MSELSSDQLKAVFRAHSVRGDIKEVIPRAGDEAVFVVTEGDSDATTNQELVIELQGLLQRKVIVVPESVTWDGHTTNL